MINKANYARVGAFVVAGMVCAAAFVYWLMKPVDERKMRPYNIYFTESVSGLNIDAPVKYRGITVGKVIEMRIDPHNNEQILIEIAIDANTPVKTDTVAKLMAQGITGLVFIDLSEGSKSAPLLLPMGDEEVAVITSAPSFFEQVGETFGSVSQKLSTTLERTSLLLDEENRRHMGALLERSAKTMAQVEKLLNDEAIANVHSAMAHAASASEQLDAMMPRVAYLVDHSITFENEMKASFASIMNTYKEIGAAMTVFKQLNESGHYSVKDNVGPPMKEFELSMRELQRTLGILNRMLVTYETKPADLLFKTEEPQIGPGERP